MPSSSDILVIGKGPAGLLLATLVVEGGGSATIVAASQGTLPLWGGQFDFRNYDEEGKVVNDPYAWWARCSHGHPGAEIMAQTWQGWWTHLQALWERLGVFAHPLGTTNTLMLTPLGHLRPTYLAPQWTYVTQKAQPVTFVGIRGITDFMVDALVQFYEHQVGAHAQAVWLGVPAHWHKEWQPIHWAWYLDSGEGQDWLLREVGAKAWPSGAPLVFPQVLGIDHTEGIIQAIARKCDRDVGEVPLPAPAIGGLRLERRWMRWLRRQGVHLVSGQVVQADAQSVTIREGRILGGARVVQATGGLFGGGMRADPSGMVVNTVSGDLVEHPRDLSGLFSLGYDSWREGLMVGRLVRGCDPDRHGDGGAMILLTAHEVYDAIAALTLS